MSRQHKQMGERIRKARRLKDITQQQLAEALNVSVQSVSQWETGRTQPDSARLYRLADLVGESADFLRSGSEGDAKQKPIIRRQAERDGILSRYAPIISKAEAIDYMDYPQLPDENEEIILAQNKAVGSLFACEITERDEYAPLYMAGDIFVLDNGVGFRNGDIVLALDFGNDALEFRQVRGRRLDERDRDVVDLRPLDPDEPAATLDLDEPENQIIATVVEHRRVRRR